MATPSQRACCLDLSALSPQEWSAYEGWAALVDTLNGKLTLDRLLSLVECAVAAGQYDAARTDEVRALASSGLYWFHLSDDAGRAQVATVARRHDPLESC